MAKVTRIEPTIDTSLVRKLRCAAYCRVSSGSEDQLHSYAAQVKYYSKVLGGSETEELIDIYADEGITGTCEDKRDEFKRLIKDCRRGKIDRIYVKSISRFARNTKDCIKNIRELKELGITIFFEKENIDTAQVNDEMIITIMGGLAQEESTSISQNMRWSIQNRMRNGTYDSPSVPYGYIKENGKLVIDSKNADVVKMIYSWYLSGMGIESIIEKLNEMNIHSPHGHEKWHNDVVSYILKNERYIGKMLLQKSWSSETIPVRRYKNKGEKEQYLLYDCNEPIIDKDIFNRAQKLLAENSFKYYKPAESSLAFSKKIKCYRCKCSYKHKKKRDIDYWICSRHDKKAANCNSKPVEGTSMHLAFIRLCNKLILHHREILLPLQRALQDLNSKKLGNNTKVLDIRRDIAALNEHKHVISRLRTKGFLDEKKYNEQLSVLENKKARLERELNRLSKADDEDETLEQVDTLIDCFEGRTTIITEFDDELFGMIVERIMVRNNILEFHLISGLKFNEEI